MQMVTTDRHGQVVRKPFFWSWSRLEQYELCAKKFYHNDVVKDFPRQPSPEMNWGSSVHQALADRIMKLRRLPAGMEQYEVWADRVLEDCDRTRVKIYCELKMAITAQFEPCEYFDKTKPVWFRTVADVLKIDGPVANLIDWKTGKIKEDSDQLALGAAVIFATYPEVEAVKSTFVWLQSESRTSAIIKRADIPVLWGRMLPRVQRMEQDLQIQNFAPKPSGICKRHCNVTSCPHFGVGSFS